MRKLLLYAFLLAVGCSQKQPSPSTQRFTAAPDAVLQQFDTWWQYHYQEIQLSRDFAPLDTASQPISKAVFLQQFASGRYVVLKKATDSLQYQLYKIPAGADENIGSQARQEGITAYARYQMEGKPLPGFHFTDLNGQRYDSETTKGKIVVLKCWFIHCVKCVEEMPALNTVVQQYQNRKDVLFVSLAFDTPQQLKGFLTKTKFDYAVVPVNQAYLQSELGITMYPTHIILNRHGKMAKVVSRYKEMLPVLQQELAR